MKTVSATQAARNFNKILDETRTSKVTIERQGRPVAVMYSIEESQAIEEMKVRELNRALREAQSSESMPFDKAAVRRIKANGRAVLAGKARKK